MMYVVKLSKYYYDYYRNRKKRILQFIDVAKKRSKDKLEKLEAIQ